MKSLLCLFLFLAFCSLSAPIAIAADAVRGALWSKEDANEITPEQIDEAFQISDECKSYEFTRQHYDCDCIGMNYLELRRQQGSEASSYSLKETAKKMCPNTAEVAGIIYSSCLNWAPATRGDDYQEFCSCYGNEYARIYAKNPSENQLVVERQMVKAMSKCNVGAINQVKKEQFQIIKKMKKDGTYDTLLPGTTLTDDQDKPIQK